MKTIQLKDARMHVHTHTHKLCLLISYYSHRQAGVYVFLGDKSQQLAELKIKHDEK